MTPSNKIKRQIILESQLTLGPLDTDGQVMDAYDKFGELDEDDIREYEREFRKGQYETNITPDTCRHYSSKSVATKMCDGTYVGWVYWYGGGKYGEPQNVDWMEDAYALTCVEEEKLVVVRTFSKT